MAYSMGKGSFVAQGRLGRRHSDTAYGKIFVLKTGPKWGFPARGNDEKRHAGAADPWRHRKLVAGALGTPIQGCLRKPPAPIGDRERRRSRRRSLRGRLEACAG